MQKNVIFIPQQLLHRIQPYLLMRLMTVIVIMLFLNISNLSIPLNFIYPKIRIPNLDEHTSLCKCELFADRGAIHDL